MKHSFIRRASSALVALIVASLPATAQACTVCMGDVNSKTAGAMNAAIFLMIGVIGAMLASLGAFAFYLARRAAAPGSTYSELDSSDTDDLS